MRIKTAPNRPVPPTSSSARRVAASPILSAVTLITTVATLPTKRAASTSLATPPNSLATTAVASRPPGNAIPRTIAATVAMKEVKKKERHDVSNSIRFCNRFYRQSRQISAPRRRALIFSSPARVPAIASRSRGFATAITIVSTTKTKKAARPSRVLPSSSSAETGNNASTNRTNATASPTAMTAATKSAARL